MRRVRYNVAMSLDGFIADEDGGYDWIVQDPTIDFEALFAQFDTLLMGRKTFEVMRRQEPGGFPGMDVVVFSRTLQAADHPDVTVVGDGAAEAVAAMKVAPGKDLWLFGGGVLFRTLLDAGLVDSIEVAVIPVLLSRGIPMLPPGAPSSALRLVDTEVLPSGIVILTYTPAGT